MLWIALLCGVGSAAIFIALMRAPKNQYMKFITNEEFIKKRQEKAKKKVQLAEIAKFVQQNYKLPEKELRDKICGFSDDNCSCLESYLDLSLKYYNIENDPKKIKQAESDTRYYIMCAEFLTSVFQLAVLSIIGFALYKLISETKAYEIDI